MPNEEHKAHDYLLGGLIQVESIHSIKLVARAYNPKIGNEATNRLYIFFPDMHLISRQRRKDTDWHGFNHERMFVDILKKIVELRNSPSGIVFHTMQLGDFVDLWRIKGDEPSPILDDYAGITWYMFRGGSTGSVDARFVIGNHDGWLAEKPVASSRWHMRLFFPIDPKPTVYVTHGDIFDPVEKLPDELKAFFVYLSTGNILEDVFGGDDKAKMLGELRKIREKTCRNIGDDNPAEIGALQPLSITRGLSDMENVKNNHKFLETAMERVKTFDGIKINASVIAHTHRAAIAVDERTGFTLMDVGAWTGDYVADGGDLPCCQIGVVCGNDFRVYQLDPDTSISNRYEDTAVV
jgi:UDP-2,3-diacylglucosamine pyrophosphatase LpxH